MKIRSLSLKIWAIIITGVLVIFLIIGFSFFAKSYYKNSSDILNNLILLKNYNNKLKYQVLYSNLFLYSNNDNIAKIIHHIRKLNKKIDKNVFFKKFYKNVYEKFKAYENEVFNVENDIFEYLRYNQPLKNSLMYLLDSIDIAKFDKNDYKTVLHTISLILLYKNSLDDDFIKNIDLKKIEKFKNSNDIYEQAFYRNLKVYLKFLPKQRFYLNRIINSNLNEKIDNTITAFRYKLSKNLKIFEMLSYLLVSFIIIILSLLIIYIVRLDDKIKTITYLLEYDSLTGLKNRFSFKKDIKKYNSPIVVIFNIDKFKNINDYFGSNIGDKVLKEVGLFIEKYFKNKKIKGGVYRVGADDFAFIFENVDINDIKSIVKDLIEQIEIKDFKINETIFNISMSAGISKKFPYLENADIALKNIKKDIKDKFIVYDNKMNKDVFLNIKKSKEIKEAIDNYKIIPYYQPIFDKEGNICKYEVLCRVKVKDEIKSIYPYLEILKENKLYHRVTQIIIKEAFNKLYSNKNLELSINLSVEDILNKEILNLINQCFLIKKDISKRVTFEILESEIENYNEVNTFIKVLKQKGVKFAIDDFGSGYSNFNRILNLDIDYLKIDGSIIKDILYSKNSKLILETIINFSKKADKVTIAEFVENKEIYDEVKKMGIDCFQGYYLAKPSQNLEGK
ncbi:EAL domain-containing protein [Caminibacter mediatlanticus TB-2]|uniref:EAL domain-containing protein n=1 Tax=Caminibacter mediatlanticus TB-2 TaxID=391592 RepID=A0ABX5VAH1_9BACT|nr:EAL domain-containing protein [Caminibacter mediatlanticus]QCT95290.1 EAL domain-containing protein [Caminibacter mediatlanticus TB-2]